MSPRVVIYLSRWCGYCDAALRLLAARGVTPEEIVVDGDRERRLEMERRSGRRTVPQVFIAERYVGGYEDLRELERSGELDALLSGRRSA